MGLTISLSIPKKEVTGLATQDAKEPLIAKTANIRTN
jgi:hypothetical protein